jgi:asparagine synthase (glutamine-hydrolysing)
MASASLADLRAGDALAAIEIEPHGPRITLARDVLGRRSLVYARIRGGLLVASGEHILLAHPEVSGDWDEHYIAAHLAIVPPPHEASAFRQIRTLIGGDWRQFDGDGERSERRLLQPDWSWQGQSDATLIEHTGELLQASVRASCAGHDRVAISLSGGIDSASVAAAIAAVHPASLPRPLAVTYGFDEWPQIDERPIAAELAAHLGLVWTGIKADRLDPLAAELARPINPDTPLSSLYREFKQAAYAQFVRGGASLWLDGGYGDHLCARRADTLVDALRFRRWHAVRAIAGELLASPAQARFNPALRRLAAGLLGRGDQLPQAPAGHARARELWRAELQQYQAFPRPRQAWLYLNAYAMATASGESYYAQQHGVSPASPYRDVALGRWLLSLPADLQQRHGQSKWLIRQWLRGRIPETVHNRPKSSDLTPFLRAAMTRQRNRLDTLGSAITTLPPSSATGVANATERGLLDDYLRAYLQLWAEACS